MRVRGGIQNARRVGTAGEARVSRSLDNHLGHKLRESRILNKCWFKHQKGNGPFLVGKHHEYTSARALPRSLP